MKNTVNKIKEKIYYAFVVTSGILGIVFFVYSIYLLGKFFNALFG